jgi:tetratricopeptide (TPR) repeat protein
MKPACVPWLLALALVAAPRVSSADPADTKAAAAADASGRAHFQRGQRLSASGDYPAAYREFAAGYALTERPLFLFNMGEAARASGEVDKAREAYRAFLRADPANALAVTAQQRLDDLERARPAPATTPPPPLVPPPVAPMQPPSATAPIALATVEPPPAHRPIYKKWPFWAVVAGGAIAGGVVVYAVTRDGGFCTGMCRELNYR